MLQALNAAGVRRWGVVGLDPLEAHRAEIDDLNVCPGPDRDTRPNLLLSWRALAVAPGQGLAEVFATEGAHVVGAGPTVEVVVVERGQPHAPLLVGVE